MTFTHAVAMTVVGVVGILVAFWIFSSLAGTFFFFVKVAVVVAASRRCSGWSPVFGTTSAGANRPARRRLGPGDGGR